MGKMFDVVKDVKNSQSATYHRGKSWEHCYAFFRNYKKFQSNKELLDRAALHLGFFLASWGMLRGSSFLLQKDYKFYISIVKTLVNSKYDKLWDFDFSKESRNRNVVRLFKLKKELNEKIKENNRADGDNKDHQTDLIITKIIMATMGCVPSYDRYFKDGLKKWIKENRIVENKKRKFDNFNEGSFKNLLDLTEKNKELKKVYKEKCFIRGSHFKHPPMKLLDLYFWLNGAVE